MRLLTAEGYTVVYVIVDLWIGGCEFQKDMVVDFTQVHGYQT